jgi:putative flavoprotein involved in K+ transport
MTSTDVVIIGAGQAGLAMSRSLSVRGIDHVVLERGEIGERWRRGSWNSLRLLTPASYSALPGLPHADVPSDYFLPARDFIGYLDRYARHVGAPVVTRSAVRDVRPAGRGYSVTTDFGAWKARAVVVATGACDVPFRPAFADSLPDTIKQIMPSVYRSPERIAPGGVLVVGASATGLQLAQEIHASGRPVTLAVGSHTRLPRRYRGLDIFAAMDLASILNDRAEACDDIEAVRRQPSGQLVGWDDNRDIDLPTLQAQGVRIVGRLDGIDGTRVRFDGSLAATTTASHRRMVRTLQRIEAAMSRDRNLAKDEEPVAITPFIGASEPVDLDLKLMGIRTVVWATGYVRQYPWLRVPVLDTSGEIRHHGGATTAPGLYVLGQRFMRRRRSHFIDGCGIDAEDIAADLAVSVLRKACRAASQDFIAHPWLSSRNRPHSPLSGMQ